LASHNSATDPLKDPKIREILSYKWWRQSIELGNGIRTPGGVQPSLWTLLKMPENLIGKSFLDVGANDGMFSFEAEKRGATRIVASDLYKTGIDSMKNGWSAEGINLLRQYFHSKVEIHTTGIYDLQSLNGKFDVVFVNNIINWLDNIEAAMDNLAAVCGGRLYLSDGFILDESKPIVESLNKSSLRYMYNVPFVVNMLAKRGFKIEEIRPVSYEKVFVDEYLQVAEISSEKKIKVYEYPELSAGHKYIEAVKDRSDMQIREFYHLNGLGWIHENEVTAKFAKPSSLYKLISRLGLSNWYYALLDQRRRKNSHDAASMIVATKN
jgi:SAM-dependent methyltransferase